MHAVTTENLNLWFGSQQVLNGITFAVNEGEVVAFLGPSGCGKSTLLRVLGGIIPKITPARVEGKVYLFDSPLEKTKAGAIDLMSQEGSLLSWRTALENTQLGMEILGRRNHRDTAQELLQKVGLNGFCQRLPRELSGGMRQRVALAATLITQPELLLMDEPLANLDSLTRESMWQLIEELINQNLIKTALFVTHSIEEAVVLANRIFRMSSCPCRIIEDVPVEIPRPRIKSNGALDPSCLELANYLRAKIRGDQ